MKKIFFAVVAIVAMAACTNKAEMQKLQAEKDSLIALNNLKDTSMTLLAQTMSDIQSNLNAIKETEKLMSVNMKNGENASKSQIQDDIDAIYSLLVENKTKVANLQAQLRKSATKNKEFETLVAVLQKQIDEQNEQIVNLQTLLEERNIEIGFLNNAVIRLSTSVDSLATVSSQTQKSLQDATDNLEAGFYITAEKSVLKANGLISSDGLFSKKVLSGDFDQEIFTQVNTTEVNEIELNSKKAKILTNHDVKSYTLETNDDGMQVLVIKDKKVFWQVSKYLVVQTK